MSEVPFGYLIPVFIVAWYTAWALLAPRAPRLLATMSFYFGLAINELPFLAFLWLLVVTLLAASQGDLQSPAGWATAGLALVTAAGIAVLAWRGARAIPAVRDALDEGLGPGWRAAIGEAEAARFRPRFRLAALLGPFFRRRRDVERIADISYGDAGARNRLDLYRHRSWPGGAPVLIHFHGGAMVRGKKNSEGLPLIYRLASHGWLCLSANYRLQPGAPFPAQLIDAKKVIAWARAHSAEYGGDPSMIFVSGGSAGGQLAVQAALTINEPAFQPGFEGADSSVAAAISLYGYYGWSHDAAWDASVERHGDIPPLFMAHGDRDTLIPVESARDFVAYVRARSPNPLVYVELPDAQHTFDLYHSIRNEAVIDGIESFAAWVRATRSPPLSHEEARP